MKNHVENKNKVKAAEKVLEFAKQQGFLHAFLSYEDDGDTLFDSIDDLVEEHDRGDSITVRIFLTLDEEFEFEINDESEAAYK